MYVIGPQPAKIMCIGMLKLNMSLPMDMSALFARNIVLH